KVGQPAESVAEMGFMGRPLPERWVFGTHPPLAFSRDGRMLASLDIEVGMKAGQNGIEAPYAYQKVRLADSTTGRVLRTFGKKERDDTALAFSPDGRCLATRDREGVVLWEIASGKPRLRIKGLPDGANLLAFSPDSRLLATAAWSAVHVLDPAT